MRVGEKYSGIVKEEIKLSDDTYNDSKSNYVIYASTIPDKKLKVGTNANLKPGQIFNKTKTEAAEMFDFTPGSTNFDIAAGVFKPKKPEFGAKR